MVSYHPLSPVFCCPMPTFFTIEPIAKQLAQGQLAITANQRLASRITAAYAHYCRKNDQQVVDKPNIFSLQAWLDQRWQQLLIQAQPEVLRWRVLSTSEEYALWEQVVEQATKQSSLTLLQPATAARQAAEAYRLLILSQLSPGDPAIQATLSSSADSQQLQNWIQHFETLCQDRQYLPGVKRNELLLEWLDRDTTSDQPLLAIGFDTIPPLINALLTKVGTLQHYVQPSNNEQIVVTTCESMHDELYSAALWAKQQLQRDANATVAIVVPELVAQRQIVQRIVQEVFAPTQLDPTRPRRNPPFNISAAYSLIDAPIIQAALNALALCLPRIDCAVLIDILASPFYCISQARYEQPLNQLVDSLYRQRQHTISTNYFCRLVTQIVPDWPCTPVLQQQTELQRKRPFNEWLAIFNQCLAAIGWPGERQLDSEEYQQVQQWQQALADVATQHELLPSISYPQALQHLRNRLAQIIFQPETPDSALQILGTLEAAGLQFSHLWLTSMSAQQWPPMPKPNPLLPFYLQRDHAMPHATAERQLAFAQLVSERLLNSASQVVISYPAQIDNHPAQASRLFHHYPTCTLEQLLGATQQKPLTMLYQRHRTTVQQQRFTPGQAPNVTTTEPIRGGSQLLADQAACPFRAFARHRLHIEALPTPQLGLSAIERGLLVHQVLESIWLQLHNKDGLLALTTRQQRLLCEQTTVQALQQTGKNSERLLTKYYYQLEQQRMVALLDRWLAVERQRANFTIHELEGRHTFRLAQLELSLRIDRIDRLNDGRWLIIDYKTTQQCQVRQWLGERLDEPQLPLYQQLLKDDGSISGIAFAKVHIDEPTLLGIAAEDCAETTIRFNQQQYKITDAKDWQQLTEQWHSTLTALAQDFIAGAAAVDPKKAPQTCVQCDLASVCRVQMTDDR